MKTKLTLTVDDQLIAAGKDYARRHEKSLSGLVEEYLRMLRPMSNDLHPDVKALIGIGLNEGEDGNDIDVEKTKEDYLIDKYLHD